MSIFEIGMLVCFGLAWPFSIYKSWTTREVGSKSFIFLLTLLVGYFFGILHKIVFDLNWVVYLYVLNGLMVMIDLVLYLRNRLYHFRKSAEEAYRVGSTADSEAWAEGEGERDADLAQRTHAQSIRSKR